MFTGIIEQIGTINKISTKHQAMELSVLTKAKVIMNDIRLGDSISINGTCLTVTGFNQDSFTVDVMPETFRATTMSLLKNGSKVNLERSLAVGSRMGGHFVTGHVDGTGEITSIKSVDNAINYLIKLEPSLLQYCIFKGSIAIDGVSLTIFVVNETSVGIALIPHTVSNTTLGNKKVGDKVNIECDMLSKYVANLVRQNLKTPINKELLHQNGFI